MADAKTKPTGSSVSGFINAVKDETTRKDCHRLAAIMKRISKQEPKMWGPSIVGFGSYHYKYPSGREGDSVRIGFSPRSGAIAIYMMTGLSLAKDALKSLGKHKTGGGCLYIKRLDDVDEGRLEKILATAYRAPDPKY